MKRIALFLIVNIAVLSLIYILLSIFNVRNYIGPYGIDYGQLLIYSAIIGFAGSFISLFLSKWLAKRIYSIVIINQPANQSQRWLLERVEFYAKKMSLPIPEIGVYQSSEVNAFATGASKKSALVAFSVGLLETMDKEEADGVIGHEMAHIANGDMVTLALIQGVVNTFVIFLSRVAAYVVGGMLNRGSNRNSLGFSYFILSFVFQIVFGILASPIVFWFSRQREFKADAMSAYYGSKQKMVSSLKKLQTLHSRVDKNHPELQCMKISGKDVASLFSTHPPLSERIKKLEESSEFATSR